MATATQPAGAAMSGRGTAPLSDVILTLPEGRDVEFGHVLDVFGTRAHGTALLLLSVPDAVPVPLPSFGAILGVPLALISLHLAVFGDAGGLPRRFASLRLPARSVGLMKRYVAPTIARAERVSRPRLAVIAGRKRLVGAVCVALSLLLLLPIPFMNTPPSLCLALLAWGMIQRDGLFVAAGLAFSAALGGTLVLVLARIFSLMA
jgi:hypothetical protein